jgi:putative peptidoglycan lipid II flippase
MSIIRASRMFPSLKGDHRRIVRGLLLGGVFILLGRFAGTAKEMMIAWRFGISGTVDAFNLASTLVGFVPGTLAAVSATVLVPLLVRSRDDPVARARFVRELNLFAMAVGALLIVLGAVALPPVVRYLAAGLSEATRNLAVEMSLYLLPLGLLTLWIAVFSARLQACERHVNTLLEALPATVLVFVLLAWPETVGYALALGTVLGLALHAIVLGSLASRADGATAYSASRSDGFSPYWKEVWLAVRVLLIGQFAMSFIGPLDQYAAARVGDSAIAMLGYAGRISALLLGIGALAIARATLPAFSEAVARGDLHIANRRARTWAWLMTGGGVVTMAIVWPTAPSIVSLLFQRGAFTADDTAAVAELVRWSLVQLPFYFGGMVVIQLLAARGRYDIIGVVAFPNMVIKLILNEVAVGWFGLGGVLFATGAMYMFSFFFFMMALHVLDKRDGPDLGSSVTGGKRGEATT